MSNSEVATADSHSRKVDPERGEESSDDSSGQQQTNRREDVQPTLADIRGVNARQNQSGDVDNFVGQLEVVTDHSEGKPGDPPGNGDNAGSPVGGALRRIQPVDDGDGGSSGDSGKFPKEVDSEIFEASREANAVARELGLRATVSRNADGELQYEFYYKTTENELENGAIPPPERHQVLTTTDGNYATQLEQMQRDKIKDLEKTFNVDINTSVGQVRETDENHFTTRLPTFDEMHALESALYRSQPDTLTGDSGEQLRINFVDEKDGERTGGFHHRWSNEVTMVNFSNFSTESQQKVIEHEIAHHGQSVTDDGDDHASDDYYSSLGYTRLDDDDETWAAQTKDNQLYTWDRDSGMFYRRNQEGDYLDERGRAVDDMEDAQQLTGDQMGERAVTPHVHGGYPSNPREMDAEAHAYLRHSAEYREQLYDTSRDMYFAVKERDQDQINTAYGVNEDGTPKWIREPNGTLVENTRANQQTVAEFELGLANKTKVAEDDKLPRRKGHGSALVHSGSCCT